LAEPGRALGAALGFTWRLGGPLEGGLAKPSWAVFRTQVLAAAHMVRRLALLHQPRDERRDERRDEGQPEAGAARPPLGVLLEELRALTLGDADARHR